MTGRAFVVREGGIDEARMVEVMIPEFAGVYPAGRYQERLSGVEHLVLVAEADGELVGYVVGYAISASTLYSWQGGVAPAWRGAGVGEALRLAQEAWASSAGFSTLRVKVKALNRDELLLLLYGGYVVTAAEGSPGRVKVVLEKDLHL